MLESKSLGVCARNRPARGTVAVITPRSTCLSVSATGVPGIAPVDFFQCGQKSRNRARRDDRTGGVVDKDDVGSIRNQRFKSRPHTILTCGAAGDDGQAVQDAVQCGIDQCSVTDGLQQVEHGRPEHRRRSG